MAGTMTSLSPLAPVPWLPAFARYAKTFDHLEPPFRGPDCELFLFKPFVTLPSYQPISGQPYFEEEEG